MMVAHTPVIFTLLWQAVIYRRWAIFMNANPGMDGGGVSITSKGEVLENLRAAEKPGGLKVARFSRIGREEGGEMAKVKEFMLREKLSFPLVIKPEQGERGFGVEIVHHEGDVRRWLSEWKHDFVVQEFVSGVEFGVHWSWMPGEEKGEIKSICGKHSPVVIGDGRQTLEELIIADDRAVLMAKWYFQKYKERLYDVIAKDEVILLAEIGTYSHGAVFSDERELWTEKLQQAFDEMGMAYEGFHIGRYDVKVPSREEFRRGEKIRVIELNGVTGVPSHIYEPGFPLIAGMKDFCQAWIRACRIGWENLVRGRCDRGLRDLWEVWMRHLENRRK